MIEDIKLTIIGDTQVGKTSIALRYVDDSFQNNIVSTNGGQFLRKSISIDGKVMRFQIWDTAGQERFRSLASLYYRTALAVVIVFDVTRQQTYNDLDYWVHEVRTKGDPNAVIVIVGNKIDAGQRIISKEQALLYATSEKIKYFETSALTGYGINEVFGYLAQRCVDLKQQKCDSVDKKKLTKIYKGCC
ncbi:Rab11 [Hexamita inflata]|uniref:Rab11 n=1 Tax=Hexamita inflata TaxID=28002 RepID=A0AA86U4W1_9EUKA|nr:Rab11 [Hexamita inflata]